MSNEQKNTKEIDFDVNGTVICCLCGKEIPWRESNNPWPLADCENRCCHDCNSNKVLPARFEKLPNLSYPAFLEVGDVFLPMDDEHFTENINKATEYFFNIFNHAKNEIPNKVYRAILHNGYKRIGSTDSDAHKYWTGFLMGVKALREIEQQKT